MIVNQRVVGVRVEEWTKAIPEERDRWQARVLVWVVGGLLVAGWLPVLRFMLGPMQLGSWALRAGIVSLTFAVVVWALRAATRLAAFFGGVVCFLATVATEPFARSAEVHSGLMPLIGLFVLTYLAGKAGRLKTRASGAMGSAELREERRGRSASQVLANLGAAGLISAAGLYGMLDRFAAQGGLLSPSDFLMRVALLGALAEATADTVSSEIGAAFGGRPFLVTTLRRVEAGTDGAVSVLGTAAGCVGAGVVVAIGVLSMGLSWREGLAAFVGGVVGLLFDSLLGATVERRGWVGNDWVNFLSTVVGGVVAWGIAVL